MRRGLRFCCQGQERHRIASVPAQSEPVETWDYKPELITWDDKPFTRWPSVTFQGPAGNLARPSVMRFAQRGQTGKWVSDLIPHLAELTDDIAFVLPSPASLTRMARLKFLVHRLRPRRLPPASFLGHFCTGSENEKSASVCGDSRSTRCASKWFEQLGTTGFLPAAFQGTTMSSLEPVRHLSAPGITPSSDRAARRLLEQMNSSHLAQQPATASMPPAFQLRVWAARMQLSLPELNDLSTNRPTSWRCTEPNDSQNKDKAAFARNCILARRLVERGVRLCSYSMARTPAAAS